VGPQRHQLHQRARHHDADRETADRLQVSNRLDANESILAGARYINLLKELLPEETEEPDRTWLALAAYNIGPGHFNAARTWPGNSGRPQRLVRNEARAAPARPAQICAAVENRQGAAARRSSWSKTFAAITTSCSATRLPWRRRPRGGLKKLVIEIEERRKAYARKMAAAKALRGSPGATDDEPLRLPTIEASGKLGRRKSPPDRRASLAERAISAAG
jgi:membrane-bound lytic murein transglycosylase F